MRTKLVLSLSVVLAAIIVSAATRKDPNASSTRLKPTIGKLKPLHQKISKPGPMDWLAQHKERGQTFAQYLRCRPVTPQGARKILYIQPLGEFTDSQRKIVKLTADYMDRFFNLEVRTNKTLPLSVIPAKAKRKHPAFNDEQILSTYVLYSVLKPKLPADAAAIIAFTSSDLWPGEGWNFVFGQASIRERVGVWSIYRNGYPDKGEEQFALCLLRTIKTAVHETGHMFSMLHCTKYECLMCGSNHREESDRRPVYLCPECMPKVCWATGTEPVERYRRLQAFCKEHGFKAEEAFFQRSIDVLEAR